MGLLKHLLFWPVTGPTFLTRFALGKVGDTVRQELTDDQVIREELLALQMRLELGEIDDDEYVEGEAALMQRLREVRAWREEFGMSTPGGPVRVVAEFEGASGDEVMAGGSPERIDLDDVSEKSDSSGHADRADRVDRGQPSEVTDRADLPDADDAGPADDADSPGRPGRGGIASPEGAEVEIRLDWDQ